METDKEIKSIFTKEEFNERFPDLCGSTLVTDDYFMLWCVGDKGHEGKHEVLGISWSEEEQEKD